MTKTLMITLAILFLTGILGYLKKRKHIKTLRELDQKRARLTRAEYVHLLLKKGFDKRHIEVVHDNIRQLIDLEDFSMHPEDDIHSLHAKDDFEAVEFIRGICNELHLGDVSQKDFNQLDKEMIVFNAEYILTLTKKLTRELTFQSLMPQILNN